MFILYIIYNVFIVYLSYYISHNIYYMFIIELTEILEFDCCLIPIRGSARKARRRRTFQHMTTQNVALSGPLHSSIYDLANPSKAKACELLYPQTLTPH